MAWYKIGNLAALSLAIFFAACGGDSSSNSPENTTASESDLVVATFEDLPVCSSKREGATAYVKDEKIAYVCENADWVEDDSDKGSSSINKTKSSSSGEKVKSSSSVEFKQDSTAYDTLPVAAVKNKFISGVSQKGPFVNGSSVKLYELDGKSYSQTGKSFTGKIASDDGKFTVSSVTLTSQYALLEANGYFRNEISGKKSNGTITLNALTDLSERKKVNINLLTHLEYERALYLIGTGINVPAAKKQAEAEIFNAFGIQGKFANSEDLDIFSKGDENAALLAFSVLMLRDLNEADLTELLTKFATDIEKDGKWDDETTKTQIADWAMAKDQSDIEPNILLNMSEGLSVIRSNIEKWDLGVVPNFEKYVRDFWYSNYGLGNCDTEGKIVKNQNTKSKKSTFHFICKNKAWRIASVLEYDTYKKECSKKGTIVDGNVVDSNKYVCDADSFRKAMDLEVYLNEGCVSYNKGESKIFDLGSKYTCTADGWIFDSPNTITDSRDGEVYKTITIGNQIWMAENLRYDAPNSICETDNSLYNGPMHVEDCAGAARIYMWSDAMDSVGKFSDNSKGCGYDGNGASCSATYPIRGICPEGWHLPSTEEFETLKSSVGGGETPEVLQTKGFEGWPKATDAYGFSAIPIKDDVAVIHGTTISEKRYYEGRHESLGINATGIFVYADDSYNYQSVRCLKDNQ